MLNLTLLTSAAKSALVGAVATKVVDTLISSKVNNKIEHNKWLRNTKLELFSSLVDDIFLLNHENFDERIGHIRRNIAKIVLVFNDRKLTYTLEKYLDEVLRANATSNDFYLLNKSVVSYLKSNISF